MAGIQTHGSLVTLLQHITDTEQQPSLQWQSAKARGKDSLRPSAVSIRTSTY